MKPSKMFERQAKKVIVFGESKSGKSRLVAELLKHGYKLHWVSLDGGHTVIHSLGLSIDYLDDHLELINVPDTKEQTQGIFTCLKIMSGTPVDICDAHGIVNCGSCKSKGGSVTRFDASTFDNSRDIVVFDHAYQIAVSALNAQVKKMAAQSKGDDKDPDIYKPEWSDWRVQGSLMDRFFTNVQAAPFNIIVITQATESVLVDKSKKILPVIGTDNFSANAGRYVDTIVYCEVINGKHRYGSSTDYKLGIGCGSRYDYKIEGMTEPSLSPLFSGAAKLLPQQIDIKAVVTTAAVVNKPAESPEPTRIVSDVKDGEIISDRFPPMTPTPNVFYPDKGVKQVEPETPSLSIQERLALLRAKQNQQGGK